MGTIQIRYYNVIFYLRIATEKELFMFQVLGERIDRGEALLMKDIAGWCKSHNIEYSHKFYYRKDYTFCANIWNFYSYIRFQMEQSWKIK